MIGKSKKIISDFKAGKFNVLYITYGCGAYGLNLHFCQNIIFAALKHSAKRLFRKRKLLPAKFAVEQKRQPRNQQIIQRIRNSKPINAFSRSKQIYFICGNDNIRYKRYD